MTIYTIGHSTRSFADFLALVERSRIERLVDVRAFPGSRRHPQFNRDALAQSLPEHGMEYLHRPALGGRRRPRPDAPPSAWRNEGFRGYADYMRTLEFHRALDELIKCAAERRTVIMCSEAVPWRCHRSLISDALYARGVTVEHILDSGTSPHALTSFALVRDGEVSYPPTETDGRQVLALGDS
ncbi:MAG TPA: DUF488 domain-containing protein [Gemmatimonadaceae bacterium]